MIRLMNEPKDSSPSVHCLSFYRGVFWSYQWSTDHVISSLETMREGWRLEPQVTGLMPVL